MLKKVKKCLKMLKNDEKRQKLKNVMGWTDGPTNRPRRKVACTRLKMIVPRNPLEQNFTDFTDFTDCPSTHPHTTWEAVYLASTCFHPLLVILTIVIIHDRGLLFHGSKVQRLKRRTLRWRF